MKAHLTMPTDVITVPCLSDNYAFVIGNTDTNMATVVDVPEAAPINAVLAAQGWTVETVLLTHHHDDHVMGLGALTGAADAVIVGAAADAHRLPPLTRAMAEGDTVTASGHEVQVLDVSGHTNGHVAYYIPAIGHAFTADSLMARRAARGGQQSLPSCHSRSKQTLSFARMIRRLRHICRWATPQMPLYLPKFVQERTNFEATLGKRPPNVGQNGLKYFVTDF